MRYIVQPVGIIKGQVGRPAGVGLDQLYVDLGHIVTRVQELSFASGSSRISH
ncbi:MAG: hypothetical protein NTX53_07530 [candidate division WOR-3 bacterium]|nr:hypothetical protein [candidate division WOR-3 bacterium]